MENGLEDADGAVASAVSDSARKLATIVVNGPSGVGKGTLINKVTGAQWLLQWLLIKWCGGAADEPVPRFVWIQRESHYSWSTRWRAGWHSLPFLNA